MGLFGALFAGVSGLNSQSNKVGVISNNISNVNTVGYKQGQASFNTLVVPSGTTSFSPGGVISNTQNLVSQQGLIQATSSPTDIAITGNGFFAVNTKSDGSGSLLLTRAGSFTQDSTGNFINANGFFLQGIPITTPPTSVNLNNLETVTINQGATGTATATSLVTLGANFNAAQTVLLGSGVTGTMLATNGTNSINVGNNGNAIIVGNDIAGTSTTNNLTRDVSAFTITNSGSPTPDTFTYGGFTISRSITDNTVSGLGKDDTINISNDLLMAGPETLGNNAFTSDGATDQVTVNVADASLYAVGQHMFISGATAVNNLTADDLNGERVVTNVDTVLNKVTFTAGEADSGGGGPFTGGGAAATAINRTNNFTGNMLNAASTTTDFLAGGTSPLSTGNFTSPALKFSIQIGSDTPLNFTYSAAPDPANGTFNTLASLATAINDTDGLTARIVNGRLYVGATDADSSVTFINGDATGTSGSGTTPGVSGIDWLQELGLPGSIAAAVGTHRFNSLNSLAAQINSVDPTNLVATVNNPNAAATITINEANPEQTINFTDAQIGSSVLKELGIANLTAVSGIEYTTGTLSKKYDPTSSSTDMSSGAVTPQFSHDITIFDAQGNAHTIAMNVVKIAVNQWAVELTAVPETDVTSTTGDGQIASGTLTFDGTGLLTSVTGALNNNTIPINWTNGASASSISFNLGIGLGTGITQSAAAFNVSLAQQNGSPIGQLTGVTIDSNGFVIETFSNGQTQQVFKIPLASVSNPDGLQSVSGDAFQETLSSGQVNLNDAGTGGTGSIAPSALEQSNVDLSTQLTSLIVAQQAYGANSKLLTVASQLLQQLDQIIQ